MKSPLVYMYCDCKFLSDPTSPRSTLSSFPIRLRRVSWPYSTWSIYFCRLFILCTLLLTLPGPPKCVSACQWRCFHVTLSLTYIAHKRQITDVPRLLSYVETPIGAPVL